MSFDPLKIIVIVFAAHGPYMSSGWILAGGSSAVTVPNHRDLHLYKVVPVRACTDLIPKKNTKKYKEESLILLINFSFCFFPFTSSCLLCCCLLLLKNNNNYYIIIRRLTTTVMYIIIIIL